MKKINCRSWNKGFTLIELLIVIALLGALAIGLIGAIDPFEQLKKGTDTGIRNSVSEVQSAIIRYYALKGRMPWCGPTGSCVANYPSGMALDQMTSILPDTPQGMLSDIVDTGELKSNFTALNSSQLSHIYVTGTDANATVCFFPNSKSFRTDNNSTYNKDGSSNGSCPSAVEASACNWCVQ